MKTFFALAIICVTAFALINSAAAQAPRQAPYAGDWSYLSERFGHGQQQGQRLIDVERCILNQIYTNALGQAATTIQNCAAGNRYGLLNVFS